MSNKVIEVIKCSFKFLFTKDYKKNVDKKSARDLYFVIIGVMMGIFGSLMTNITVTSMYRIIDNTLKGNNLITFSIGIIGIFFIVWLFWRLLSRLYPVIINKDYSKKVRKKST